MAVTFESHGYDTSTTNPYTESAWAWAHPSIGQATYGVRSPLDWKVSAVAGQDRTVSIAAGMGFGYGVTDSTFANDTIQLDTIASGSRWDLVAVRRDWTPTAGLSQFVKINGGATATIPGGRNSTRGNIDDQPLALVQVTAGQTQPTAIIDLRTWSGDGGALVGAHDLVRSFLNRTGTRININGEDWLRRVGANDTLEWVKVGEKGKVALHGAFPRTGTPFSASEIANTGFMIQAGSTVLNTEANGYGSIFLTPFPNGIVSATVCNGNVGATGGAVTAGVVGTTKDRIDVKATNGSGVGYSGGPWRCDWVAVGW